MRAGKHVLCEKPMALDAREVAAMIRRGRSERRPAGGRLHVQVPPADRPEPGAHPRGPDRRGPLRPFLLHLPLRARRRELPLVPGHGRRGPLRRRLLHGQHRPARLRRRARFGLRPGPPRSRDRRRHDHGRPARVPRRPLRPMRTRASRLPSRAGSSPSAPKGRSGSSGPSRPKISMSRSRSSGAAIRKRSPFRRPTCSG